MCLRRPAGALSCRRRCAFLPLRPWVRSAGPDRSRRTRSASRVFSAFPGDCVYLMRDSRRTPDGHPVRQSYRLLSHVNRDKLDIFRIEKLWKNEKYVPRARRSPGGAERAPASPVEPQPSPVLLFQRGALRLRPPLFPAPRNPPFSIPPFLSQ